MKDLLKCPFCGGDADLWYKGTRYGYIVYSECSICGAKSKAYSLGKSVNEDWADELASIRAIEAWNRRI